MAYPTLEEFVALERDFISLYVKYKTIVCYMRKGYVYIDGVKCKALTIANIVNARRRNNGEFDLVRKSKRTGLFAEFEGLVRKLALENGYDGVMAECVHNEFLPDVLIRYGYRAVNIYDPAIVQGRSYWCKVNG